jgi:hypothetical protein
MKSPKLVEFEGKWLTVDEIAKACGYTVRYINYRISRGKPLNRRPSSGRGVRRHMYKGKLLTVREIALDLGLSTVTVYERMYRGKPLEDPAELSKSSATRSARSLMESGERELAADNGENGKFWQDDLDARVWHMYCGGDEFGECTLSEIAALWGLSRERVRQIEESGLRKIRIMAKRGNADAAAVKEMFEALSASRSLRRLSHWEQCEQNAPGNFELTSFHETNTYLDIAKKFGDVEYGTQAHVQAAYSAAARRRALKS